VCDREESGDVTALLAACADWRPAGQVAGFEIGWVAPDGIETRMPLTDALPVPFESALPVRASAPGKGSDT